MKIVKITTSSPEWPLIKQTPGSKGLWGDYKFYINDDKVKDCDYWVVIENLMKKETIRCPKENTILILGEPPQVKKYDQKFINQFSLLITCQRGLDHPRVINYQPGLSWFVGFNAITREFDIYSKNYDELKKIRKFNKTKLISIVTSNKTSTEGHKKRLKFIELAKKFFPDDLDIYGARVNMVPDKWDALAPYKYHIALENNVYPDYWTEKISDAYLAGSFPFYSGCPNLSDYFSPKSFLAIDINKPEETLEMIKNAVNNNLYEKSIQEIDNARNLILDKYNLFALIADRCNTSDRSKEIIKLTLAPECVSKSSFNKFKSKLKNIYRPSKLASFIGTYFKQHFPNLNLFYLSLKFKNNYNESSQHQPWANKDTINWLGNYLKYEKKIFEYGCGNSTLFYAKNAGKVVSVEHDPYNYLINKKRLKNIKNCQLLYSAPTKHKSKSNIFASMDPNNKNKWFEKYVNTIAKFPDNYFDLVSINGEARNGCLINAVAKVKNGGFILLNNSERAEYKVGTDHLGKFRNQVFAQLSNCQDFPAQTTIWYVVK